MQLLLRKLKPKKGFANIIHIVLTALLPLVIYALVRIDFLQLAVALVLLSKWRMFAVKARHWPAHLRSNAVDIIVGISTVLFMAAATAASVQMVWVVLYTLWLLYIKPKSSSLWVGAQALIGQLMGLMALYIAYGDASTFVLVSATALICYLSARHFFSAFDENLGRTTAYVWSYFAASLTWLLGHWLIYYSIVAQPVLIITLVGYTLAVLYYLRHTDRLSVNTQRQFVVVLGLVLMFLIIFSDWGDKAI